ncbi:tRNA (adenosine(37)-N6)-dimethylallyltransferase MiaA [Kytococcus schroeteri]|uniref:tRNA dimethylallyltransferase n=1 Tax=Kytococcus schroeteri TaxID=138300 RepID=A0A2I1PD14_9MICO|nr:tRNA (adenosine(37)-N6)-dimethylallyltransferase MiaA [Kytococcus schroeteri]PKZ42519.1 tRNA (adenosine(37)-N6)-dimethylallyltransferase MiaA [Kytococcus schroeteri]
MSHSTPPPAPPTDDHPLAGPVPVVAVVGQTATGKSDLGLALAERLGGEVVNSDASQLYRGMDIGTAKLSVAERRGVPHHQLDVLDVTQEATVARFQADGREDMAGIRQRGHVPVVVGGTGLYVRALLDRLEIPPTDPAVRAALEQRLEAEGVERLYAELQRVDAPAAAGIEPRNGRRVVRALEVIELTGRPFSSTMPTREFLVPTVLIGLRADDAVLHPRIDARVERMWAAGLLEEVRALDAAGLRTGPGRTARRAIGYSQALAQLDGEMTQHEAIADTQQGTRRLARRQRAWYRPDPRIVWLEHDADDLVEQALAVVRAAG